ncbi:MAG: hypothetical protein M1823_005549 [Watsoniomyces obsoletus]|nr:MAG: hypothetical protein M1823_005549 [Watsoniomyces obsoletus]
MYISYRRTAKSSIDLEVPEDVSDRYDDTAETFDKEIEMTEWLMGMGRLRRKMARMVKGHVLEVSVGTGRNMRFYDWKNKKKNDDDGNKGSWTFVEKSGPMLEKARGSYQALHVNPSGEVRFLLHDALEPIPPPPSSPSTPTSTISSSPKRNTPLKYDTIIQTMGLCSTPSPTHLLQNLSRHLNPDHGRILLLEHGRSHYNWLNHLLDSLAKAHANRHGCWWNRDIGEIVRESGLEVVRLKRYHLGTTWWVELKVPSSFSSSSSSSSKTASSSSSGS